MIDLALEWNRPYRPLAGSQTLYLAVRMRPPSESRPQPLSIVICLDVSSSMKGERLASAKTALLAVWRALLPGDRLSVLTFGSVVQRAITAAIKGETEEEQMVALLHSFVAEGRTVLAPALAAALQELMASASERPGFLWVVSDGEPTCARGLPLEDPGELWTLARQAQAEGITLGTVALGDATHYDARILFKLAEHGGGAFCYAREARELTPQLEKMLRAARVVNATQGVLQLELVAGARLLSAHRFAPDYAALTLASDGLNVLIGPLQTPETVVLLEIAHAPPLGSSPGSFHLGSLRLRAAVVHRAWESAPAPIELELVASPSECLLQLNAAVDTLRIQMELARNAERRLQADTLDEKMQATQDLLEWGRRSSQLPLVARFEHEAHVLATRGQLNRDEELRGLVELRGQELPHA